MGKVLKFPKQSKSGYMLERVDLDTFKMFELEDQEMLKKKCMQCGFESNINQAHICVPSIFNRAEVNRMIAANRNRTVMYGILWGIVASTIAVYIGMYVGH